MLLLSIISWGQNIGSKYYRLINQGLEGYYLHNDIKYADSCFKESLKISPPTVVTADQITDIYLSEKDYENAFLFLKYRIMLENSYPVKPEDRGIKEIIEQVGKDRFYTEIDSCAKLYKLNYDIEFTKLMYEILGRDQMVRDFNMHKVVKDKRERTELIVLGDSTTYFMLKTYIEENGCPNIRFLDGLMVDMCILTWFMHLPQYNDSVWGNGFFYNLFEEQYRLGRLPNYIIPYGIEKNAIGNYKFGLFTPIDEVELELVDSLRTAYDLPILAVDAKIKSFKLPQNYKINDKYTVYRKRPKYE